MSQEAAGQQLNPPVTRQSISKWELGRGSPNPRQLAELCTAYGVSTDLVLVGVASQPNTGSAVADRLLSAAPADERRPKDDFQNSTS